MTTSTYWQDRERIARALSAQTADRYNRQAQQILQNELAEIQKEIESFYQRYADENGLSMADVKKRVDSVDLKQYQALARQYVQDHDMSEEANRQMKLYNLTISTSRLKYIQACINLQIVKHSDMLNKTTQEALYESAMNEYQREAGILGMDVPNLDDRVQQLVDGSFHDATWSDRIWKHQKQLRTALFKTLQTGLIQGKNPRDFISEIRSHFNVTSYQAERLLRTEFSRVEVGAQLDSIKQTGASEVVFINAEDPDVCAECRRMNNRHFLIKDLEVGVNQPPIHPNCRCSLGPYYGDDTFDKLLEYAKDPIAENMTFEQWMDFQKDHSDPDKTLSILSGLSKDALNKVDVTKYFDQKELKYLLSHAEPGSFLSTHITVNNGTYVLDPDTVPEKKDFLGEATQAYENNVLSKSVKNKADQLLSMPPEAKFAVDLNSFFTPDEVQYLKDQFKDTPGEEYFNDNGIAKLSKIKKNVLLKKIAGLISKKPEPVTEPEPEPAPPPQPVAPPTPSLDELVKSGRYIDAYPVIDDYFSEGPGGLWDTEKYKNSLTRAEYKALQGYTENDYEDINRSLRAGLPPSHEARLIKDALDKAPALPTNLKVYRGVGEDAVVALFGGLPKKAEDLVGRTMCDKGFMSTSIDNDVPGAFYREGGAVFTFELPKGAKVGTYMEPYTMATGEQEFLLKPGLKFKVESSKKVGDTYLITARLEEDQK